FADITVRDAEHAHWRVQMPVGKSLEWEVQTVEDRPGELVRWEMLDGASLPGEGALSLKPAPGDRGTEATLRFHFDLPGGAVGNGVAKVLGSVPKVAAAKALRRFKSLAETGEIPTTRPQPAARADKD
ncbi:MAG: SRPBCC family protein, partial [Armatimonadota bacterium]